MKQSTTAPGNNASISQTSMRSNGVMNSTAGNFGNFTVAMANTNTGAARNSVVGGRHIPITKFTRGSTRGRTNNNIDGAKRISQINFYTNSQGGSKLKNALDLSVNNTSYDSALNSSSITLNDRLNESMGKVSAKSGSVSNSVGAQKPNTAFGNNSGSIYDGVYN